MFTNSAQILPSSQNPFPAGLARQIITPAPKAEGLGSVNLYPEPTSKETTLTTGQAAMPVTIRDTITHAYA